MVGRNNFWNCAFHRIHKLLKLVESACCGKRRKIFNPLARNTASETDKKSIASHNIVRVKFQSTNWKIFRPKCSGKFTLKQKLSKIEPILAQICVKNQWILFVFSVSEENRAKNSKWIQKLHVKKPTDRDALDNQWWFAV